MPGPLAGIRVLDLTVFQQGPQATMLLADLGADVIKVEERRYGDLGRALGRAPGGFSAYFYANNRGKRSIAIDLGTPGGHEAALALVDWCDVFVHNFRPGVMERLGLGYEALRDRKPALIYAHASAWGTLGPKAYHPGFDIAAQARSGMIAATGEAGSAPVPAGAAIADFAGSQALAQGVLAALFHRERTGEGQKVEVSLLGAALWTQCWEITVAGVLGGAQPRAGRGHHFLPSIWRVFRTADGWAVVGGVGDDRWHDFCLAIEMPALETDARFANSRLRAANLGALFALLDPAFGRRTTAEWIAVLEAHDMICAPVASYADVLTDEQALANGYVTTVANPAFGPMKTVDSPLRFSATPGRAGEWAPEHGQHSEEVLLELGFDWPRIEALRAEGAI